MSSLRLRRFDIPPIAFIILAAAASAVCWLVGEIFDRRWLRCIAGPAFSILLAIIVVIVTTVHVSFSDSVTYSGATKEFIGAIVAAIDRGDVDAAHAELRKYDEESIETYEGGEFLRWLREPTERLKLGQTSSRATDK